ncbi:MAG TPA: CAP domain-containing protein, partial [Cytophagaceae bacterium]
MKIFYIFIVSFFLTLSVFGQNENDPIDFKEFNQSLLRELVLKHINNIRDSLQLAKLKEDSILTLAAKVHSNYVKKTEHLLHVQEVPEFATLDKRVEYYKGTHEYLGENVEVVPIDKPTQIYKETATIKVITYGQAAYFFRKTALNTTNQFENISSKQFSQIGIHFAVDEAKKLIYMVLVFGSKPYTFPPSIY